MLNRTSSLAVLFCLTSIASLAAERQTTLSGAGLSLDSNCARQLEIRPDPGLTGQVAITVTADNQEEIDRLVFDTASNARIRSGPQACWRSSLLSSFEPTLTMLVRVPTGFPLHIDASGAGSGVVGDVGGPLDLNQSGAGRFIVSTVTTLSIELSGEGDVRVAKADGVGKIDLSGAGHVSVGQATMATLTANLSGAGTIDVQSGQIDRLLVDDSGFGTVRVGATVGDALVNVSGLGGVHLAKVTGALRKDVSGVGAVTVGP